ncbi:hypothetical protein QVD17_32223 [Tagetes erecta]|uniref:C2H2-type domain-containing protein n=1 Tax=Tagetes erecta TaxID=13708 RepID=A0AAD8NPI6_TARER|nr:hypothetical protein QVD17_32223 [Tagetes erecta]
MAVLQLPPSETHKSQPTKRRRKHHPQNPKLKQQQQQHSSSSSWDQIKNLLKCKQMDITGSDHKTQQDPIIKNQNGYSKLSSCSSICSFRDVANGNTRVVHNSPESTSGSQDSGVLRRKKSSSSSSSSSLVNNNTRALTGSGKSNGHGNYTSSSSTSRGMQFRKLSGCYECHAIIDPARSAIPRSTICLCSECGEVFPKMESLEHHQAVRHAVTELGPEDSGRNIVEIIFKSSWQNKNHPIFTIERILKINNTRRTIQRFEDCRNTVKNRATATATTTATSRCAADGNELLRFHCTTLACSLGSHGSSSLCNSVPNCGVCTIIRHGFQIPKFGDGGKKGVCTTASSGRAHDSLVVGGGGVRAMIVCRVIAGKVKRVVGNVPSEEDAGKMKCVLGNTPLEDAGKVKRVAGNAFLEDAGKVKRVAGNAPFEDAGKVKRVFGNETSEEDAGKMKRVLEEDGPYDSVAGLPGQYSGIEELYVYNPRAILPCFVVVYKAMGC